MNTDDMAALFAELTNKIRWAINSSLKTYGLELGFQEAMRLGSHFAQDAFDQAITAQRTRSGSGSTKEELQRKSSPNGKGDLTGTRSTK